MKSVAIHLVMISCRTAQAAMFPLRIAVAINSGKKSGVHAKLGNTCEYCPATD